MTETDGASSDQTEVGHEVGESSFPLTTEATYTSITMTNFLSYKHGQVVFSDLIALVGPNASGKSNAVAAIKLLREIPIHGLPTAIARRGGFDQLRHRSAGRPYDPGLRLTFQFPDAPEESFYELKLSAVKGKHYEIKNERARLVMAGGHAWGFDSDGRRSREFSPQQDPLFDRAIPVAPGQSALATGGLAAFVVYQVLTGMQTVEINPVLVGEFQEPSSTKDFEPDGSNATSIFESLDAGVRSELFDELAAVVPGISKVEVRNFADKQTLVFYQDTRSGRREFFAKQMSDGTLRTFSILLAMLQPSHPRLLVIEEPEIAIHLGALRTLVDLLKQQTTTAQIVITTHSADIIDSLPVDSLRVVWNDGGASHVSPLAEHTKSTVREGLITPGQLLRSDSLDPEYV